MSRVLRVALMGYGYWGRNVARAMREGGFLVSVHDVNAAARARAERAGFEACIHADDAIAGSVAVAVCTPPDTHAPLVGEALRAGRHVWVEKPVADRAAMVEVLLRHARDKNLVLMADHTFAFAPAVRELAFAIHYPDVLVSHVEGVRTHKCAPRSGADVVGDLLPHDASILIACGLLVTHVRAVERANTDAQVELLLEHASAGMAGPRATGSLYLSWASALKQRRMTFYGRNGNAVVYDHLDPREPVRVHAAEVAPDAAAFSQAAVRSPAVAPTEPLAVAVAAFRDAVAGAMAGDDVAVQNAQLLANAALGVQKVVDAARESARGNGEKWIEVRP